MKEYLSKNIVDISVVFGESFRELIVLFSETSDIDTTQWISLREW